MIASAQETIGIAHNPDDLLQNILQFPMFLSPSPQEFHKGFKRTKPGKVERPEYFPFESFMRRDSELRNRLMLLILQIWESQILPNHFRDVISLTIYKAGKQEDWNDYWGISLLNIASKIFDSVLLICILILKEDVLSKSHAQKSMWIVS